MVTFATQTPSMGTCPNRWRYCQQTAQLSPLTVSRTQGQTLPSQLVLSDPSTLVYDSPAISAELGTTPRATPAPELPGGWHGSSVPPAQTAAPTQCLFQGTPRVSFLPESASQGSQPATDIPVPINSRHIPPLPPLPPSLILLPHITHHGHFFL